MGKGDKKTRRGKIILGSNGVRRPKSSKNKAVGKVEAVAVAAVVKNKKAAVTPKAEPKPKAKAAETEIAVTPEKTVKKAVKKAKEDVAE